VTEATLKSNDSRLLDAMTGGAFSAPTSGERAARVRDWLASNPSPDQMQEVFRELSGRDKGAAKLLREKLDEIKRSKGQEALAAEWAEKARTLLDAGKLNIADAMAWQRDAAKAGAPLSREPLASIKVQLGERVKGIEDLEHRVQVQREAAVLLAQRIEVLSTKSWRDAQAAADALAVDVPAWQAQAQALLQDSNWTSIDTRFRPLLEASRLQLQAVWDAFQSALVQAVVAAQDPAAPLPPVPVWADELRAARGVATEVDPEVRARAVQAVREVLAKLEQEIAQGHGKASAGAAAALRNALKEHGKLIDDKLENQAHAALAAAGELEGWQRWRADQLRQELVAKAEALFEPLATKPSDLGVQSQPSELQAAEGEVTDSQHSEDAEGEPQHSESEAPSLQHSHSAARKPRYGGRKMQEQLRALREQWKQTDQGGAPNHALWKRFDDACNEAYKVVEAWLDKVKAESAEHKAQRLALVEEVKSWAAANPTAKDGDWKGFNRILHQFEGRWRDAGHVGEKAFAELQPLWKEATQSAAAPLQAVQKQSLERRQAMIEEAKALGAAAQLRLDAVKALQQRWQAEAQVIPLERKHEQKLWDAFRKPIDEAFNRKSEEREKAAAALGEHDRTVLEASKALEAANATGDAQKIKTAMAALEAALRGQAHAMAATVGAAGPAPVTPPAETPVAAASASLSAAPVLEAAPGQAQAEKLAPSEPASSSPKPPPKPVIAMRGDDRPGMKKAEPVATVRGGKFGDRKPGGDGKFGERRDDRRGSREARPDSRFGDRLAPQNRGPRLGDTAFRAQREALDHAQLALKKLAAQAHGEALTQLLTAWEHRSGEQVPTVQELGKAVTAAMRGRWVQAIGAAPSGDAAEALLRLEIAAEAPTPADYLNARRMLQLQLLTRRNDPSPAQTWGEDTARVLAGAYDAVSARRLQAALKTLLRR
jgi:ATP-dependent RNA helicase SUPV3L1/SUV3